jgi:hypothetical protein
LYSLGRRPVHEYIREVLNGADPATRLRRYGELDPAIVKYLGADAFDRRRQGGKP